MTTAATQLRKPAGAPRAVKPGPDAVQIVTRFTDESRAAIKALAEAEGLTMQQLGVYAWSLALQSYGRQPLPEAMS